MKGYQITFFTEQTAVTVTRHSGSGCSSLRRSTAHWAAR